MVLTGIGFVVGDDQLVGAQRCRAVQLRLAAAHRDHAAAVQLRQLHEHQPDGAQSDDGDGVARARSRLFEAADHAGQRLHQGGVADNPRGCGIR